MHRLTLSEIIKNAADGAPKSGGASGDYALVRQNFDLIAEARDAGLRWRAIAEAAEFERLESPRSENVIAVYFRTIQKRRQKAAAKAAARSPAPAVTPPHAVVHRPLPPPPPGSTPAASPGDIFDSLPSLSAARKAQ